MKFLSVALLVVSAYVAAADECNMKEEITELVSTGAFLDLLQACINLTPSDSLRNAFDKMKTAVNEVHEQWVAKCTKDEECSEKDLDAMWDRVLDVKEYLEEMQGMSNCKDISNMIQEIRGIQDRCNDES